MRIKLIAPARKLEWGESFWDLKTLCKLTGRKAGGAPLALPTLAALTPSDIEVILTDENVEPIDFNEKIDLVGITGMTCLIPRSYEIADEFKKRGVPVVMGGIHVSMLPEEAAQHCDSVVIGEAEELWEQVLRDAQLGKLQKSYKAPRFPDLTKSPIPRWDLMKYKLYPIFPVQAGRGCPYDCEFCSVQTFNGRHYRYKEIKNIIQEIEYLKKLEPKKPIFFIDDNILSTKDFAEKLLNSMFNLNIKWWCQASVAGLNNNEILELMYKSGCREIFIGFESVLQESLNSIQKSIVNRAEKYKEIVDNIHLHGMAVFGSFILGTDNDDIDTFKATIDFIENSVIGFSMINILTPLPGTKLYEKLNKEGRLCGYPWEMANGEHVCFKPRLISSEQLENKRNELLNKVYSYKAMYNRLKKLWDIGVHINKNKKDKFFKKNKFYITFKSGFSQEIISFKRLFFIIRSLWLNKSVSLFSVILALNFHDYVRKLKYKK